MIRGTLTIPDDQPVTNEMAINPDAVAAGAMASKPTKHQIKSQ